MAEREHSKQQGYDLNHLLSYDANVANIANSGVRNNRSYITGQVPKNELKALLEHDSQLESDQDYVVLIHVDEDLSKQQNSPDKVSGQQDMTQFMTQFGASLTQSRGAETLLQTQSQLNPDQSP